MDLLSYWWLFLIAILVISSIKINSEWERAVILRLGRYKRTGGPGLFIRLPFIEKFQRLDTRTRVMDVEKQSIITRDSVTVEVDAFVYYRIKVNEASKAILNVENWEQASTTLAQTTLRDKVGKHALDDLLSKKDQIGKEIKEILDRETDEWGIAVTAVEIKDVIIPESMERAMAKEAEATREKRARVTKAEGELEASKKLKEASEMLAKSPHAVTLRQLQTWQEIGAEQNSLVIVVPSEMANNPSVLALANQVEKPRPVSRAKTHS
jgi:regulator of protease activity HflC (stomatin/prohibitin superfamily)